MDLRSKIRAIEDEKHSGLLVIKDLESERAQLQSQILHIQQKEKGELAKNNGSVFLRNSNFHIVD
jgi:hypothetical protein